MASQKKSDTTKVDQTSFGMTMNTTTADIPICYVDQCWDVAADNTKLKSLLGYIGQYSQSDINEEIATKLDSHDTSISTLQSLSDTVSGHTTSITNINDKIGTWSHDYTISSKISDLMSSVSTNTSSISSINSTIGDMGSMTGTIASYISSINSKIPSAASSSNQLADKDFVNSSINNYAASFRGTYETVADLRAQTGSFNNNDYANVVTDEYHSNESWRYVYVSSTGTWTASFKLNDTTFTADQLKALNSGITASLVATFNAKQNALPAGEIGKFLKYSYPEGYLWYDLNADLQNIRTSISNVCNGSSFNLLLKSLSSESTGTVFNSLVYKTGTTKDLKYAGFLKTLYSILKSTTDQTSGTDKNFTVLSVGEQIDDSTTGYALGALRLYNGKYDSGSVYYSTTMMASNDVSSNIYIRAKSSGVIAVKPEGNAVGSSTQGTYVDASGTIQTCSYTLEKSVGSDAKLTDTTYASASIDPTVTITTSSGSSVGTIDITATNVKNFIKKVASATADPVGTDMYLWINSSNVVAKKPISTLLNYLSPTFQSKVDVSSVNISGQTVTILSLVKALSGSSADESIHYKRWHALSDGLTSGISDKPTGTTNASFVCEARLTRWCGTTDYKYVVVCWVKDEVSPYVASVAYSTSSISWTKLPTSNTTYTASNGLKQSGTNITIDTTGTASGINSLVEGQETTASGLCSHAEGKSTSAEGNYSHTEGLNTIVPASGICSHAEGDGTTASGTYSHTEGLSTTASGLNGSHAEGYGSYASGNVSHAEGNYTTASGTYSHAEGSHTTASGDMSHTEGYYTTAQRQSQHVFGEYNILDTTGEDESVRGAYIEIVGNGTSTSNRTNARTLDWSGNQWLAGSQTATSFIKTGGTSSQFLKADGSVDSNAYTTNTGTVTSITINATSPIKVNNSAAITASGSRTISHETSGATAGSYGDSSAQTPSYGGTFKVPYVTVNATGHVTAISEHTVKIPVSDNTDTNVTQSETTTDNWRKVLLSSQRNDTAGSAVVATTNQVYDSASIEVQPSSGTLRAKAYLVNDKCTMQYNSTDASLDFIFS